ncbi:hypothetical protein BCR33DRAFT_715637 [Rhizoclosmatium globosum]|uniref:Uncharacterized protein n=1 Tax=Rhizoclosmatium globosum TaxID=329046 RepID=A0A1Y2CHQ9_9FUNG|nr:hypothetical protein BCR33DRAFT_715637 [Rhizoclosmatium globosum]|eukprot:ORY46591.1 hypothetical protein BCR33DRAFT_715637 [Rhizoclosmatium globosum]
MSQRDQNTADADFWSSFDFPGEKQPQPQKQSTHEPARPKPQTLSTPAPLDPTSADYFAAQSRVSAAQPQKIQVSSVPVPSVSSIVGGISAYATSKPKLSSDNAPQYGYAPSSSLSAASTERNSPSRAGSRFDEPVASAYPTASQFSLGPQYSTVSSSVSKLAATVASRVSSTTTNSTKPSMDEMRRDSRWDGGFKLTCKHKLQRIWRVGWGIWKHLISTSLSTHYTLIPTSSTSKGLEKRSNWAKQNDSWGGFADEEEKEQKGLLGDSTAGN